ncbi:hypothetical protein GJ496_011199, partial [Pomphorhynchus laevis]
MTAATIATGIRFNRDIEMNFNQSKSSNISQNMHKQQQRKRSLESTRPKTLSSTHINYKSHLSNLTARQNNFSSSSHSEYSRLTIRKIIHRRKQRLSDLSLIFAMLGLSLMILETELTISRVYGK